MMRMSNTLFYYVYRTTCRLSSLMQCHASIHVFAKKGVLAYDNAIISHVSAAGSEIEICMKKYSMIII